MLKIRCTSCNARLKLPESFTGGNVKCPKCGVPFSAEVNEPTASESGDPVDTFSGTHPELSFEETSATIPADMAAVMAVTEQATKAARIGKTPSVDFAFKRYWTPVIIRFSWFLILAFAFAWIAFLTIAFVGSWFRGEDASLLDAFGMSDLSSVSSVSSLDLEGLMNGKADVDSLNRFLDDVTEQESAAGGTTPQRTAWQSFMAFGFTTLSFLTLIASLLLTVLFCRVFFETIVVLFDISRTLRNIEEEGR